VNDGGSHALLIDPQGRDRMDTREPIHGRRAHPSGDVPDVCPPSPWSRGADFRPSRPPAACGPALA